MALVIASITSCYAQDWAVAPVLTSAEIQTHDLREEHADVRQRLDGVEAALAALAAERGAADRAQRMSRIYVFFTVHLVEQARIEQRTLYDYVDAHVEGPPPTTVLRYEHDVIRRETERLGAFAAADDVDGFVKSGYELVGLCRSHIEVEGRVLTPVLERLSRARTAR